MEKPRADAIADELLKHILANQPELLSHRTSSVIPSGADIAQFCEQFVTRYSQFLQQNR